jgi:hypothetical protein
MSSRTGKVIHHNSALYFIGFIGALVYFLQHATGFWYGVLGVFKAMVWPAFLVYKLFIFLKL